LEIFSGLSPILVDADASGPSSFELRFSIGSAGGPLLLLRAMTAFPGQGIRTFARRSTIFAPSTVRTVARQRARISSELLPSGQTPGMK
jgi:hypothetical protein